MTVFSALPQPFTDFPSWERANHRIWLGVPSWFYGAAVKDNEGQWRMSVIKLFLGARGIERPRLPSEQGLFIDGPVLKVGTLDLEAVDVADVLFYLVHDQLHPSINELFGEPLLLPDEPMDRRSTWQADEEIGSWSRYPRQTIARRHFSRVFAEWTSPPARRQLNGILVGKIGGTFQGLSEIAEQLRFRHPTFSSSSIDSSWPVFEVAAELPLLLKAFSYDRQRGAYVVRVRIGADVTPERVSIAFGGGPRTSSQLSDKVWSRALLSSEFYELEWVLYSAHGTEDVTAQLSFDGEPFQERKVAGATPLEWTAQQQSPTARATPPTRDDGAPEIPPSLVDAFKAKECLLFAGAGLSMAAGLPSWTEMVHALLVRGEDENLLAADLVETLKVGLQNNEFGLVADNLVSAIQSNHMRFTRFLHDFIRRPVEVENLPESYALLRKLPFSGVLTQNLDQLLEATLPDFTLYTHEEANQALGALSKGEPFLMKLLGTSSQPTTVLLSPAQYTDTLANNQFFERFLEAVLASRTLLFIGNSLDGIRDAFAPLKLSGPPAREHFALVNTDSPAWKVKAHTLKQRYGITVLPYPAGEHERVVRFLRRLHTAIETRPTEQESQIAPVLTRLQLEDIGPFERLELDLKPGWNVLLGDNGVGKSIILKALAVALSGSDANPYADRIIRAGKPSGRIILETPRQRYTTQVLRTDVGAEVKTTPSSPLQVEGLLALGIPPLRAPAQTGGERVIMSHDRPTSADLLSLIKGEPDPRMQGLIEWILQMDHLRQAKRASGDSSRPAEKLLEDFFEVIRRVTPGLNLRQLRVDAERQRVFVSTDDGPVPIEFVSQGTASVINWVGVLLRRLYAVAGTATEQPRNQHVLVLLDEFDAHMHPAWQRMLIPTLRELFPNMQVVTSTHSPLVVSAVDSQSIAVLHRALHSRQVQVHRPTEDLQGYRADQVLTSDIFGLETTHSPRIFEALQRYAYLCTQRELSPEESEELRGLSHLLKTKVPSPEERQQAREAYLLIQEVLDARLAQMDGGEARKLLEEARAQLVETFTGAIRLP